MTSIAWHDHGSGPAVVLVHAFPCDHSMWNAQIPPLVDAGWRVLVPDLPGFGESARLDQEPSLAAVVDALAGSLLERSVDRCVLVGLSVGGYLIMEWLRRHPEMVAAIALCDTKASADTAEAVAARLDMASAIEREPATCATILRERLLPVIVGATSTDRRPEVVATVGRWMDAVDPATVAWYQRAMAARPDSLETLRESEIPVLVAWGEEDSMAPEAEQRAMVQVLREGRLAVIPDAGHLSAIENPEPLTRELIDFLGAVRRASNDG